MLMNGVSNAISYATYIRTPSMAPFLPSVSSASSSGFSESESLNTSISPQEIFGLVSWKGDYNDTAPG